jgi:hypothetical protein
VVKAFSFLWVPSTLCEERLDKMCKNLQPAAASPPSEEEIRASLLRLLDLLAEKVAQKILRELDLKDRQANTHLSPD